MRDNLSRILITYIVIASEKPAIGYKECKCKPIGMKYLKETKQAVVSYGLHSPLVKKMAKAWASSNRVITHDWL